MSGHLLPRFEGSPFWLNFRRLLLSLLEIELLIFLVACVAHFKWIDETHPPVYPRVAASRAEENSSQQRAVPTEEPAPYLSTVMTCAHPPPEHADHCQAVEAQILSSTVRINLESWVVKPDESGYEIDVTTSHGTIRDGRTLVTHNHFGSPLSIRSCESQTEAYGIITLLTCDGQPLYRGPITDFELLWENEVTLVLAYKGGALFEQVGMPPAEFKPWSAVPWAAGMEVAQIDWDGQATRVDWTTVEAVRLGAKNPWLQLADPVAHGASGGGIYWQGYHVASNWLLEKCMQVDGSLVKAITRGSIDPPHLANLTD